MREFFRGWRRKAGLATLAMACLLTMAWMRSRVVFDLLLFTMCGRQFTILPLEGDVQLQMWTLNGDDEDTNSWFSVSIGSQKLMEDARDKRRLRSTLFRAVYGDFEELYVPYWSLVLPLTLLSAWLLLIKPRPAKSAKESSHA